MTMSSMLRSLRAPGQLLYKQPSLVWKVATRNAAGLKMDGPTEYYNFVMKSHELPHPLKSSEMTEKKMEELAAKWNLLPEDYKPMNDVSFDIGDYPELPVEGLRARDPFNDWDDPHLKRNWGEPIFFHCDSHTYACSDSSPNFVDNKSVVERQTFWLLLFAGLFYISYYYIPYYFWFEAPKQMPERRPLDDFAEVGHVYETKGLISPKVREMKHNTNYTFDTKYKWNPSKYVVKKCDH